VGAEPGEACGARREMIAIACALSNLALSARELRYQLRDDRGDHAKPAGRTGLTSRTVTHHKADHPER
jgi:hypothetical protein